MIYASPQGSLTCWTQNLYLGADINLVLSAPSRDAIPERVDAFYEQVTSTDFAARARGLARAVREDPPDVVCLQEAVRWRAGGRTTDFLSMLLEALAAEGLRYRIAAQSVNGEFLFPGRRFGKVFLTNRNVILRAAGLRAGSQLSGRFRAQSSATVGGAEGPSVEFNRGWTAIDVRKNGRSVRVVNAHLELPGPAQAKQAEEMAEAIQACDVPVVLAGDFNIDFANGGAGGALGASSFLTDVWRVLQPGAPGWTGCQAPDLLNEESRLDKRLDAILCSADLAPQRVRRIAADAESRIESPVNGRRLWPSDHAGVQATIAIG